MASYKILPDSKQGKPRIKITVELGYNDRGKRIRKHRTVTLNTLSERTIQKAITAFEIEVANEKPKNNDDLTYRQAVDLWWKNHVTKLARKSQKTYRENVSESIKFFGDMKIKKIKKIDAIEFKNHLIDNEIGVMKGKFDVFKSVLSKMVEWELLEDNPAAKITFPRKKTEMDFYDTKEIKKLFKALDSSMDKYRVLIKLAVLSGMRKSEIAGLTMENIDFKNNLIIVKHNLNYNKEEQKFYLGPTKNKKERVLVMPEKFMKELKQYVNEIKKMKLRLGDQWRGLEGMDLVFCNDDGYPHEESTFTDMFLNIIKRHGLRRIRFHDLRHTHASFLLSQGENIKVIQERLGHSSITLTMDTYSHLTDDDRQSASKYLNKIL